jgi:hypothetical protein
MTDTPSSSSCLHPDSKKLPSFGAESHDPDTATPILTPSSPSLSAEQLPESETDPPAAAEFIMADSAASSSATASAATPVSSTNTPNSASGVLETKQDVDAAPADNIGTKQPNSEVNASSPLSPEAAAKKACKKHISVNRAKPKPKTKKKKQKKQRVEESSSSSDDESSDEEDEEESESSSSSSDSSDSESDDSSDSDAKKKAKKKKKKAKKRAKQLKEKKKKKLARARKAAASTEEDDDSESSDDDSTSAEDEKAKRKQKKAKGKRKSKKNQTSTEEDEGDGDTNEDEIRAARRKLISLQLKNASNNSARMARRVRRVPGYVPDGVPPVDPLNSQQKAKAKKNKRASKVAFKRVDQREYRHPQLLCILLANMNV